MVALSWQLGGCLDCDGWAGLQSLKMYLGVIFNDLLIRIVVLVPEEAEVGTMLLWHGELMKHILDVSRHGIRVTSHSVEDSSKGVIAIWALKKEVVDAYVVRLRCRVEDDSGLALLFH